MKTHAAATGHQAEVAHLKRENERLQHRVGQLEQELEHLKTHPALARGFRGERLVARLTAGVLTAYAADHDVMLYNLIQIEVKTSKVQRVTKSGGHRRWQWCRPEGWQDKGKDYDLLVLIGEKDDRFPAQYLDGSPWVFFLVPHAEVATVTSRGGDSGSSIFLNTNLEGIRPTSRTSVALRRYMVPMTVIEELLSHVEP